MNDFNVARATMGLFNYCKKFLDSNGGGTPKLAVACDVRHFSTHFAQLCASVWRKMGGEVYLFDGPRSTPQLSFTVRNLATTAGIVITASHNPPHDNGYKVYFGDGAQVISPHAEGIVAEVDKIEWKDIRDFLKIDLDGVKTVPQASEDAYVKSIENCVIDKEIMAANKPKLVYTAVHGTGRGSLPSVMRHLRVLTPDSRRRADGHGPALPDGKTAEPRIRRNALDGHRKNEGKRRGMPYGDRPRRRQNGRGNQDERRRRENPYGQHDWLRCSPTTAQRR